MKSCWDLIVYGVISSIIYNIISNFIHIDAFHKKTPLSYSLLKELCNILDGF